MYENNMGRTNGDPDRTAHSKKITKRKKLDPDESQDVEPTNLERTNLSCKKKKKKDKKEAFISTINIENGELPFNPSYIGKSFAKKFHNCWHKKTLNVENEGDGLKVLNDPFNSAFLPNFFNDASFLETVCTELEGLEVVMKNNDLYKFQCTGDLQEQDLPGLQTLCKIFQGPLRNWMASITGINLNDNVSLGCSKYGYSDTLLCHDDELEGRRIAFILYLVPPWKKVYGGSLDLFLTDEHKRPLRVSKRFYPVFNSFAFFEVSPISFHQVSEVLVKNRTRLSLNGWFHGEPIDWPSRHVGKLPRFLSPSSIEEHIVYMWINPIYLEQSTQAEIRKDFKEKSEIHLTDFLKLSRYAMLADALRMNQVVWKWTGPPYKKHFQVARRDRLPSVVTEFLNLLRSEAMFLILSQLTGLSLHALGPEEETSSENDMEDSSDGEETEVKSPSQRVKQEERSSHKDTRKKRKGKRVDEVPVPTLDEVMGEEEGIHNGGFDENWSSGDEEESTSKKVGSQGDHQGEMWSQVRRWKWGCYSLMRDDYLQQNQDFLLDASFVCNASPNWKVEYGGYTVYVAREEEEEILSVSPVSNSLALVYRDRETMKFTKHINVQSTKKNESMFHEVSCEYREVASKDRK